MAFFSTSTYKPVSGVNHPTLDWMPANFYADKVYGNDNSKTTISKEIRDEWIAINQIDAHLRIKSEIENQLVRQP